MNKYKKYDFYGHFMHNMPSHVIKGIIEIDEDLMDTAEACKETLWKEHNFIVDYIKEVNEND